MKNWKLILLIISSIALLNSCWSNKTSENSSPSPTISPSTQPSQSKVTIDPELLKKYQQSQNKLIELLNKRVKAERSERIKIGSQLLQELENFRSQISLIEEATKISESNPQISTSRTDLKNLISFTDLNNKEQVDKLQKKLKIKDEELGDEKGKFREKTKEALVEKIKLFGKELTNLSNSNKPTSNPSPSATQKPLTTETKAEADFDWINPLFSLLSSSILTLTTICIAWRWYEKNESSPKNKITEINEKIEKLQLQNTDFHKLEAGIDPSIYKIMHQEIESKCKFLSDKVDKLSRQIEEYKVQNPNQNIPRNFTSGMNVTSHSSPSLAPVPSHSNRNTLESTSRSPRQQSFINDYNQDSRNFFSRYQVEEVLEEQTNIEGRRSGIVKTVILNLAPRRRGAYWVINQDNQYLVVPSSEAQINEYNLDALSAVFSHNNFNPQYYKIQLIEPAIVQRTTGGYQLVSRGRIEFQ